MNTAEIKESTS